MVVTYPEICEMQARAIIEAACEMKKKGVDAFPEIMIPLTAGEGEWKFNEDIVRETADKVMEEQGTQVRFLVGTMIEIPRACLRAGQIAESAEFFSFGTNDLTQMTYGLSRDDAGRFLPQYIDKNLIPRDPFVAVDREGVGEMVEIGIERGRKARANLEVGICGEHIRSINSRGVIGISRRDKEVVREDIDRVLDAARAVKIPADREILHVIPRGFTVDEQSGIRDPVGMSGVRLESEVHMITVASAPIRNLLRAVSRAGLGVETLVQLRIAGEI